SRVRQLEDYVDELLLIFPFEKEYFKKWKVKATYIGNPLLDETAGFEADKNFRTKYGLKESIIALLPGSRKQEIERMLPLMMEVADAFTHDEFVIAGAPGIEESYYLNFTSEAVKIVYGQTYNLLNNATAAIVCSGTATLETA